MQYLKKAAGALMANIGEAVAPLIRSNVEQLQWSWQQVDAEYGRLLQAKTNDLDDPQLLVDSKLSEYFNSMVEALVKEEEDETLEGSRTGPCFEYILQQNVIDKLCALGLPDRPPGMRTLIVRTLDAFFTNVHQHPLLPNMNVHTAVRQFIEVCFRKGDLLLVGTGAGGGAVTVAKKQQRSSLISLLHTVINLFRHDNNLAAIFYEERMEQQRLRVDFTIFSALLTQLNHEPIDSDTRKAVDGLIGCAQLPNRKITNFIIHHTDFCRQVVSGLKDAFVKIPKVLEVDSVLSVGEQFETLHASFPPFLTRLELMDRIANTTYREIGEALGRTLTAEFLIPVVQPCLLHVQEKIAKFTTWYVAKLILGRLTNRALLGAVTKFLLGDISPLVPEVRSVDEKQYLVRTTLIKRLDSLSEELSLSALALFDSLLALRDQDVMYNLLIRNLIPLKHIAPHAIKSVAALYVTAPGVSAAPPSQAGAEDDDMIAPTPVAASAAAVNKNLNDALNGMEDLPPPATPSGSGSIPVTPATPTASAPPTPANASATAASAAAAAPAARTFSDLRPVGRSTIYRSFQNLNFKYSDQFEDYLIDAQQQGQLWWAAWEQWQSQPTHKAAASHFIATHLGAPNAPAAAAGGDAKSAPAAAPPEDNKSAALLDFFGAATPAATSAGAAPTSAAATAAIPAAPTAASIAAAQALAANAPFYEGLFLHTLFSKLMNTAKTSLAQNLLLTSVLSRMMGCPHPLVHSYGFDPLLPFVGTPAPATAPAPAAASEKPASSNTNDAAANALLAMLSTPSTSTPAAITPAPAVTPAPAAAPTPSATSIRTLLIVLNDVWNRCQRRARDEFKQSFGARLDECRQRMNAPANRAIKSSETLDHERFFQSMIVLDEFIKEVIATAEVASHINGCNTLARIVSPAQAAAAASALAAAAAASAAITPKAAVLTPRTPAAAPAPAAVLNPLSAFLSTPTPAPAPAPTTPAANAGFPFPVVTTPAPAVSAAPRSNAVSADAALVDFFTSPAPAPAAAAANNKKNVSTPFVLPGF